MYTSGNQLDPGLGPVEEALQRHLHFAGPVPRQVPYIRAGALGITPIRCLSTLVLAMPQFLQRPLRLPRCPDP